jgi:hypothetical protein
LLYTCNVQSYIGANLYICILPILNPVGSPDILWILMPFLALEWKKPPSEQWKFSVFKHAVKWLALPWSLVHQQAWQWMFPGKTTQRMQIPNIHSLCLVISHIEQIIVFCFCSLNWLTMLKSVHTVFLFHFLKRCIF